jgi:hypothetical protein
MCRIYVKELLEMGVETGSAEIHPKKYSVVAADKSFRGDIQVGVTFTKKVFGFIIIIFLFLFFSL